MPGEWSHGGSWFSTDNVGTLSLSSQSCVPGQLLLAAVPLSLKQSGPGTPRQSRNIISWIPVIGALQFSGPVSYVSLTVDSILLIT